MELIKHSVKNRTQELKQYFIRVLFIS